MTEELNNYTGVNNPVLVAIELLDGSVEQRLALDEVIATLQTAIFHNNINNAETNKQNSKMSPL